MFPKFPRLAAASALALSATLVGCSDQLPTAPAAAGAPRLSETGDESFAAEAREAPVEEAYSSLRPIATQVAAWGASGQASVVSSRRDNFPVEGSRYLVISSGRADSFEGSSTVSYETPCAEDGRCDVGGMDLALTLPADAQMVEFDVRYFTWDSDGHEDPFRVYQLTDGGAILRFEATTITEFTGTHLGYGLRYSPTTRRVALNVADLAPQADGTKLLRLRFEASDSPNWSSESSTGTEPDRSFDSGALVDRLRVTTTSNRDRQAPTVTDTKADPSPVPYTQTSTVTSWINDEGTGGSPIALAEYSVDGGRYARMTATGTAFGAAARQAVSATLGTSPVNFYVRTVCVRGADDRGNMGTPQCVDQAVYDPSQQYVVGTGWFESLPGAYGEPGDGMYDVRGRASFGFSTGYRSGSLTPTGDNRFSFKAAGLVFKGSSTEYLYVNGAEGRYKARGEMTMNGRALVDPATGQPLAGEAFGLLVAATDGRAVGKPDAVRIRIWRLSDGGVIYDNHRACGDAGALAETATPGSYRDCTSVRGGQVQISGGSDGAGGGSTGGNGGGGGGRGGKKPRG